MIGDHCAAHSPRTQAANSRITQGYGGFTRGREGSRGAARVHAGSEGSPRGDSPLPGYRNESPNGTTIA